MQKMKKRKDKNSKNKILKEGKNLIKNINKDKEKNCKMAEKLKTKNKTIED